MKKIVVLAIALLVWTFSMGIAQAETSDEASPQDQGSENPYEPDESVPIEQLPPQQYEAEEDPLTPDESVPIEQLPPQQHEAEEESVKKAETLPETGTEHAIILLLGLSSILLGVSTLRRHQV